MLDPAQLHLAVMRSAVLDDVKRFVDTNRQMQKGLASGRIRVIDVANMALALLGHEADLTARKLKYEIQNFLKAADVEIHVGNTLDVEHLPGLVRQCARMPSMMTIFTR